jgi:hypothetical protein
MEIRIVVISCWTFYLGSFVVIVVVKVFDFGALILPLVGLYFVVGTEYLAGSMNFEATSNVVMKVFS